MFSVDLDVRECGDNVIVAVRGELDIADAADVAAVLVAAAAGRRKIIVDLGDLAFIDCSGAAALVRAQLLVERAGGRLLLAAPQPQVLRLFELSRLIDVVGVCASVAQAGSLAAHVAVTPQGPLVSLNARPVIIHRQAAPASHVRSERSHGSDALSVAAAQPGQLADEDPRRHRRASGRACISTIDVPNLGRVPPQGEYKGNSGPLGRVPAKIVRAQRPGSGAILLLCSSFAFMYRSASSAGNACLAPA